MNNLLFLIQQLFLPVFSLWPVWVLVILVYVLFRKSYLAHFSHWIVKFGLLSFMLVFCLRLLLLFIFPFGERSITTAMTGSDFIELPLLVQFKYGDLHVEYKKDSQNFNIASYDVSNGYIFGKALSKESENGRERQVDMLMLHRRNEMATLTKVWSTVDFEVPAQYKGNAEYRVYDSEVNLNLTNATPQLTKIFVISSTLEVNLPQAVSDQRFEIRAENSRVRLYVPEGPTYNVVINSPYNVMFPTPFQKIDDKTYKKEGPNSAMVTVEITSLNPKSLEVILVNQHNE